MSIEGQNFPYPGDVATPQQISALAGEYHRAAEALLPLGRRGKPISRAPYRLVAIQAIELYLNALLVAYGRSPAQVRGIHHDLARRAELAMGLGLQLRQRTVADLRGLSLNREYVKMRYEPDLPRTVCQPSGLRATLNDVAEKVTKRLAEMTRPT